MTEMELITPSQSRAARGLIGLSQADLAQACELGLSTVRDFETERRAVPADTVATMRNALERAGVEFIAENGGGVGVRFKKRRSARTR